VAAVLLPQDLDWYSFSGQAGVRVTIEVEARRLGAPIVPQLRLVGPSGASLALGQPLHDGGGDCRLVLVLPEDGRYAVEVRDALYRGDPRGRYRLRIDTGPFATGLFPLGGRRGETIEVAASGGSLDTPRRKPVTLPDEFGAVVDPGCFAGPGGPVLAPMRLAAGAGTEINEEAGAAGDQAPSSPRRLPFGATLNGRIERPGEVDRYAVAIPPGSPALVEVQAASLGSWLDSVVTVVNAQGDVVAEADDRILPGGSAGGPAAAARDSRIELEAADSGEFVVAISDRFGAGGPEYAYRLSVGPPTGDFSVALVVGTGARSEHGVDRTGSVNVKPGTTAWLSLRIAAFGRLGPITLSAEGLPPGVSVEPVMVRVGRSPRGGGMAGAAPVEAGMALKVDPAASPALGWLRIVASARSGAEAPLVRRANAALVLAAVPPDDPRPPPTRVVAQFPVRIVDAPKR
jgi:hypothetical protein